MKSSMSLVPRLYPTFLKLPWWTSAWKWTTQVMSTSHISWPLSTICKLKNLLPAGLFTRIWTWAYDALHGLPEGGSGGASAAEEGCSPRLPPPNEAREVVKAVARALAHLQLMNMTVFCSEANALPKEQNKLMSLIKSFEPLMRALMALARKAPEMAKLDPGLEDLPLPALVSHCIGSSRS